MSAPLDPMVRYLRDVRRERGWTMPEVAAKAGTTTASISRWESGDATPTVASLRMWAAAFGYRLELRRSADGRVAA